MIQSSIFLPGDTLNMTKTFYIVPHLLQDLKEVQSILFLPGVSQVAYSRQYSAALREAISGHRWFIHYFYIPDEVSSGSIELVQ